MAENAVEKFVENEQSQHARVKGPGNNNFPKAVRMVIITSSQSLEGLSSLGAPYIIKGILLRLFFLSVCYIM